MLYPSLILMSIYKLVRLSSKPSISIPTGGQILKTYFKVIFVYCRLMKSKIIFLNRNLTLSTINICHFNLNKLVMKISNLLIEVMYFSEATIKTILFSDIKITICTKEFFFVFHKYFYIKIFRFLRFFSAPFNCFTNQTKLCFDSLVYVFILSSFEFGFLGWCHFLMRKRCLETNKRSFVEKNVKKVRTSF